MFKRKLVIRILSVTSLTFLLVVVTLSSLQGRAADQADTDSSVSLTSIDIQALNLENPTNNPYEWPPPTVKEIRLDDGKALKPGVWGFIVRAPRPDESKGSFWIAGWEFLAERMGVSEGSAKASFRLTFLTFSRPEPSSIGEPIYGKLLPSTYDIYGGYYETAGAEIGVCITWSPADKPIIVSTYCAETGRGGGYKITGGQLVRSSDSYRFRD
ncbi:MAG: hypothetical protein ACUVQY_00785 [Thermoproteota archaeon]